MSVAGGADVVQVKDVRIRLRVGVVCFLAVSIASPAPVLAHSTRDTERVRQQDINTQIARLEDALGDLSVEEHDLAHRLDETRTRRMALDTQLARLAGDIAAVETDLEAATVRLAEVEADVTRARRRVVQSRARLRDARRDMRDRAVSAYVNSTGGEIADAVFESRDLREFGARTAYAQAVVSTHARTVDRLRAARDDAASARAEHETVLEQVVEARDNIAVQRLELEERHNAHSEIRAAAVGHERQEQALLEEVRRQSSVHENRLAQLREESESIASFLRSIQAGQAVISGNGQLSLPITGARLSSRFGPRLHPIFGTQRLHAGIDWAAATGTPVRAAASGRVVHAGERGGYGNAVIIDHGGALATMYAHLSVIAVGGGADVQRGQVIGAVGSTGFSTGPHLHFEVRVAGSPVDPIPYL